MFRRYELDIEDFRIYFCAGAAFLILWVVLPLFQGFLPSDFLVSLNAWCRIGGQLLIPGVVLAFTPVRLRFLFLLVFAAYISTFATDVFAAQCSLANARFDFGIGRMPECLFVFAI